MNALKRFGLLGGLLAIIAALSHHAMTDDEGLRRQLDTQERIARAEAELGAVRGQRIALEDKVARLSETGPNAGVDVDYLEERVRDELRFAHPHEIVVDISRRPAH